MLIQRDEVMIRDTIRGEEGAIVALVEGLIRDVMCGIDRARDVRVAPGSLKLPLRHFERVDLSEVSSSRMALSCCSSRRGCV